MSSPGHNSGIVAERLRAFIEQIETLEEEKKQIADLIAEKYAEASGIGFDKRTMKNIVRLRGMPETERLEHEALTEIYKRALGMRSAGPLFDQARKREEENKKPQDPPPGDGGAEAGEDPILADGGDGDAASAPASAPEWSGDSVSDASQRGRAAAEAGAAVTANPYPANDARRAAWDEAWCLNAGSDGMEIPEAWRRPKKPKKSDGDGAAA